MTDPSAFQIRSARQDDIRAVAQLWHDAFPGKRSVADRIRMLESGGRFGGVESVIVAEDGEIAGAAKIYEMTEYIAGAAMQMMGLAAVAVAPARRRRGVGARLCVEAI
ncbi:MAG: GNAT family N-acetyltransferase, partial [Longimicrobiales bacterium]|nr:GNAT family N-acetyltransferase [Longimicrobiales bacterium]